MNWSSSTDAVVGEVVACAVPAQKLLLEGSDYPNDGVGTINDEIEAARGRFRRVEVL